MLTGRTKKTSSTLMMCSPRAVANRLRHRAHRQGSRDASVCLGGQTGSPRMQRADDALAVTHRLGESVAGAACERACRPEEQTGSTGFGPASCGVHALARAAERDRSDVHTDTLLDDRALAARGLDGDYGVPRVDDIEPLGNGRDPLAFGRSLAHGATSGNPARGVRRRAAASPAVLRRPGEGRLRAVAAAVKRTKSPAWPECTRC